MSLSLSLSRFSFKRQIKAMAALFWALLKTRRICDKEESLWSL
jgi:hypothetical protein